MRFLLFITVLLLSACGVQHKIIEPIRNPLTAPQAEPKYERRTIAGNKSPYTVMGQTYEVLPTALGYKEKGVASWYGKKFHGRPTSNTERFDMYAVSAAHKTLPIPSYVKVTNLRNNKQLLVRINDRGPFLKNRIIDLSYAAALQLGFAQQGVTEVLVEAIEFNPDGSVAIPPPVKPIVIASDESSTVPSSTSSMAGQRYVQVGRYQSEQSARALAQKIDVNISDPIVIKRSNNSFVVAVGPLADNERVEKVKSILTLDGIEGAFTIQSIQ